jgi:hypothetical protein
METPTPDPPRPFWEAWASTVPAGHLYLAFVLLSAADLVATVRLVQAGFAREGNAWALGVLHLSGWTGLVVYKILLVGVILGALALVDRTRPRLSRVVLLAANGLMGAVALRHLAIMLAHMLLRHV